MDTISIMTALKETPIPTILVVAGIVFLLLSIAGQLAGRIAVPHERQRQAAIMGGLLLMVGIALHVVPPMLIPHQSPGVSAPTPSNLPPKGSATPDHLNTAKHSASPIGTSANAGF